MELYKQLAAKYKAKYMEEFSYLTQEDMDELSQIIVIKKYKKRELLVMPHTDGNSIFLVLDGGLKLFYIDTEGVEKIVNFHFEGELLGSFYRYLQNKNVNMNIQAIQDTLVLEIDNDVIEKLAHQRPNILRCYKDVLRRMLEMALDLIWEQMNEKPEARYLKLQKEKSLIFQRASQKDLASYLGITAESFSRMKKRIHQQRQKES